MLNSMALGPPKRIMGEVPTEGFYSRAIMDEARAARASLVWWSQRDLNPCFNPTTTSPLFFRGFEHFLQVRKGCD
jgi:hypothetical protein